MEFCKFLAILVKRVKCMTNASLRDEFERGPSQAVQNIYGVIRRRFDFGCQPVAKLWNI